MRPVRDAECRTDPEALFGEVEPHPSLTADAIVRHPFGVAHVDAAGHHQVFDQVTDLIVDECGHNTGALVEDLAESPGDVVLPPPSLA